MDLADGCGKKEGKTTTTTTTKDQSELLIQAPETQS